MASIMLHRGATTIVLIGCCAAWAAAEVDFADVRGRVLTEPGAGAAAGIVVRIGSYHGLPHGVHRETVTDADGRYRFADIPPARCTIRVFTQTVPQTSYSVAVTVLDTDAPVRDLYLRTPQFVSGVVRSAETGDPVPGVPVSFFSPNHHRLRGFAGSTKSNDDGRYRLYLPTAKVRISSRPISYRYMNSRDYELDVEVSNRYLLDFDLRVGPRFHGRVVDEEGKPASHQVVRVGGTIYPSDPSKPWGGMAFSFFRADLVTDDGGWFEGWNRGPWAFENSWAKLTASAVAEDVSSGGHDSANLKTTQYADRPFHIVMRPLTSAVVRLRTTDSKPVKGAIFVPAAVEYGYEPTGPCRDVRYTNQVEALGDGEYRLGGMVPGESYCYKIHAPGVAVGEIQLTAQDALEPVVLASSDRHSVYTLRSIIDPYIMDEPESEWYSPGGFEGDLDPGVVRELPVLLAALKEPDVSVQRFAMLVLSKMGPAARDAIPVLVERLEDEHDGIRCGAAAILMRLGDRRALPTIIAQMQRDKQYDTFGFDLLEEVDPVPPSVLPLARRIAAEAGDLSRRLAALRLVMVLEQRSR